MLISWRVYSRGPICICVLLQSDMLIPQMIPGTEVLKRSLEGSKRRGTLKNLLGIC